jgi:hypothetical protein
MKSVTILSVILDLVILVSLLTLPRTGMEAMGTAFLLIPPTAIRGL